jgi:hypothetical protein
MGLGESCMDAQAHNIGDPWRARVEEPEVLENRMQA